MSSSSKVVGSPLVKCQNLRIEKVMRLSQFSDFYLNAECPDSSGAMVENRLYLNPGLANFHGIMIEPSSEELVHDESYGRDYEDAIMFGVASCRIGEVSTNFDSGLRCRNAIFEFEGCAETASQSGGKLIWAEFENLKGCGAKLADHAMFGLNDKGKLYFQSFGKPLAVEDNGEPALLHLLDQAPALVDEEEAEEGYELDDSSELDLVSDVEADCAAADAVAAAAAVAEA
eukprot:tig00000317_g24012.t1